jgi:YegS/Rv2252/BmrU family lipid kinase
LIAQTLVILNPHAGGGRAGRIWRDIEPLLWNQLGELVIAVTQHPEEVAPHLDSAYEVGIRRVIAIGGDGTNHALVNALTAINQRRAADPMVYGNLPVGTGKDWARGIGIPYKDTRAAVEWIARARPAPTDIGLISAPESPPRHFLNIASAGIGGAVVKIAERIPRRSWTFLYATLVALLREVPPMLDVRLDGQLWYSGGAYVVAVANGTTFGHGMRIAPHAKTDDGLFDVVLVEAVARARIIAALRRVFSGTHLTHPAVRSARAASVAITSPAGRVDLECDGEYVQTAGVEIAVRPRLLNLLR